MPERRVVYNIAIGKKWLYFPVITLQLTLIHVYSKPIYTLYLNFLYLREALDKKFG